MNRIENPKQIFKLEREAKDFLIEEISNYISLDRSDIEDIKIFNYLFEEFSDNAFTYLRIEDADIKEVIMSVIEKYKNEDVEEIVEEIFENFYFEFEYLEVQ